MNYYGKMDDSLWSQDASIKPRRDIEILLDRDGAKQIDLPIFRFNDIQANSGESLTKQFRVLNDNDTLLLQLPMYVADEVKLIKIARATGARIIGLVHDVEYLRGFQSSWKTQFASFKLCDALIVTASETENWIINNGYSGDTAVMDFWPYLLERKPKRPTYSKFINYAGNLDRAPQVDNIRLYGYADEESVKQFGDSYVGAYDPNDLPFKINTGYGLVWYNDKKYQRYTRRFTASHKTSAYIASGVPIITQYGSIAGSLMGVSVDSLKDISKRVETIDEKVYNDLVDGMILYQDFVLSGNSFLEPYHNLLGGDKIG